MLRKKASTQYIYMKIVLKFTFSIYFIVLTLFCLFFSFSSSPYYCVYIFCALVNVGIRVAYARILRN
jgi:hypothetical protein